MRKTTVIALCAGAAVVAMAPVASAQPESGCGICSYGSALLSYTSDWELEVQLNGYAVVSATADVSAWANAVFDRGETRCPAVCPSYKLFEFDGDSASGSCTAGVCAALAVGASAAEVHFPYAGVYSFTNVEAGPLYASMNKQDQHYLRQSTRFRTGVTQCPGEETYGSFAHGMACAAATIGRSIVLERQGPTQLMVTMRHSNYDILADTDEFDGGCGGVGPLPYNNGNPAGYRSIIVSGLRASWTDSMSATHQQVERGIMAVDNEGELHRLGFFTDSDFDPDPTAGGWEVVDAEVEVAIDFGSVDVETLDLDTLQESYEISIGNVDVSVNNERWGQGSGCENEERICWNDRLALIGLMGLDIDDWDYDARADLNLDGAIDVDDLLLFNQVCGSTNVDNDSPAINNDDFFAYLDLFAEEDPSADLNGVNGVTNDDFFLYLTIFAAQDGCAPCS